LLDCCTIGLSLLGEWHAVDRDDEERGDGGGAETIYNRLPAYVVLDG
jgi:hypothetical protein